MSPATVPATGDRIGVLLVNLGTPDATGYWPMRRYLNEFFDKLDKRVRVDWAMRYGNPSIRSRLEALAAQDCERILIVPLYPQYAAATTATVCDEVFRSLERMRFQPTLRVAAPYYAEPVYIDALAASLTTALAKLAFKPEVILASYHGMPEDYVA